MRRGDNLASTRLYNVLNLSHDQVDRPRVQAVLQLVDENQGWWGGVRSTASRANTRSVPEDSSRPGSLKSLSIIWR